MAVHDIDQFDRRRFLSTGREEGRKRAVRLLLEIDWSQVVIKQRLLLTLYADWSLGRTEDEGGYVRTNPIESRVV